MGFDGSSLPCSLDALKSLSVLGASYPHLISEMRTGSYTGSWTQNDKLRVTNGLGFNRSSLPCSLDAQKSLSVLGASYPHFISEMRTGSYTGNWTQNDKLRGTNGLGFDRSSLPCSLDAWKSLSVLGASYPHFISDMRTGLYTCNWTQNSKLRGTNNLNMVRSRSPCSLDA